MSRIQIRHILFCLIGIMVLPLSACTEENHNTKPVLKNPSDRSIYNMNIALVAFLARNQGFKCIKEKKPKSLEFRPKDLDYNQQEMAKTMFAQAICSDIAGHIELAHRQMLHVIHFTELLSVGKKERQFALSYLYYDGWRSKREVVTGGNIDSAWASQKMLDENIMLIEIDREHILSSRSDNGTRLYLFARAIKNDELIRKSKKVMDSLQDRKK